MAHAILRFDLSDPDDEREHRYALAGRRALVMLDEIDQAIRARLKYAELGDGERMALEELRGMIPDELTNILT